MNTLLIVNGLFLMATSTLLFFQTWGRLHEKRKHMACHAAVEDALSSTVRYVSAVTLRNAADRWDSVEEKETLLRLGREEYRAGGPSMPAIWLRHEADRLDPSHFSGDEIKRMRR